MVVLGNILPSNNSGNQSWLLPQDRTMLILIKELEKDLYVIQDIKHKLTAWPKVITPQEFLKQP